MIESAVKAQLPMIAVTTTDRVNLNDVIEHITGKTVTTGKINPKAIPQGALFVGPDNLVMPVSMYPLMVAQEASYIGVNLKAIPPHFFPAGAVPVPKALLEQLLSSGLKDEKLVASVVPSLGGLTLSAAVDIVRVTMARDGSLTPAGVAKTRAAIVKDARGLTLVDTTSSAAYMPPAPLVEYATREKPYFLEGTDPRLQPRGILAAGPTGTGKTEGAKWLASQFAVPLYRLDLGRVQEMWVGSSEAHLATALERLESLAPCMVLFDEVEKMVRGHGGSSGVGASMLAQLLFWSQEHKSRVFSFMTCNDLTAIPPELIRPGRIDEVMMFGGLKGEAEIKAYIAHVMNTFPAILRVPVSSVKVPGLHSIAHADLTVAVHKAIKAKPPKAVKN